MRITNKNMTRQEIIEKKSRFIGYAANVNTEDEAKQFITGISKEHKKARNRMKEKLSLFERTYHNSRNKVFLNKGINKQHRYSCYYYRAVLDQDTISFNTCLTDSPHLSHGTGVVLDKDISQNQLYGPFCAVSQKYRRIKPFIPKVNRIK